MSQSSDANASTLHPAARGSDPLSFMDQISSASAATLSAWMEAWGVLVANRVTPVAETVMKTMATPAAWPTALVPILDEIRTALALPKFADLPGLELMRLPSPAPLLGLLQVSQDYAAISVPIWLKACERFQAEVKTRSEADDGAGPNAGDLIDTWNDVLDLTLMEFNRSGEFATAQQKLLHAAVQQRRELSGAIETMAKALSLPTRTEMTDVYQRLHDLTREVYGLRREVRALRAAASIPSAPSSSSPTP